MITRLILIVFLLAGCATLPEKKCLKTGMSELKIIESFGFPEKSLYFYDGITIHVEDGIIFKFSDEEI